MRTIALLLLTFLLTAWLIFQFSIREPAAEFIDYIETYRGRSLLPEENDRETDASAVRALPTRNCQGDDYLDR